MRMFKTLWIASITMAVLGAVSCVVSIEPEVDLQPSPLSDSSYEPVLTKNTRSIEVTDNFESRFQIKSTTLSPDFLKAFAKRYERIYKETPPVLIDSAGKAGFFVSLVVPTRDLANLNDPDLWTIQLTRGKEVTRPSIVRRLNEKPRWKAFFPGVNLWSHDFLVVFDAPAPGGEEALVKAVKWRLTFASPEASVNIDL